MTSFFKLLFDIDDIFKSPFTNRYKSDRVDMLSDVPYVDSITNNTNNENTADLYLPKRPANSDKLPVFINIHGGGFVTGDKKWRHSVGNIIAEAGIFVFAPNYRLAPKSKFPACLQDVVISINWLADNAEKYNLDTDRFYVSGDSAGGYLAVSVAAFQNNVELQKKLGLEEFKVKINGVMPLCGIYDFRPVAKALGSGGIIKNLTGVKRKQLTSYEFFEELSPVDYITKDFPQAFILNAGHDIFTAPQPLLLKAKLDSVGVPYQSFQGHGFTGSDHCFHLRWRQKQSLYVFRKIIEIINGK